VNLAKTIIISKDMVLVDSLAVILFGLIELDKAVIREIRV